MASEEKTTIKQWAGRVGAVVLVGLVGVGVWRIATGENDAVKRKAAEVSMLMPTLPPPPPPPEEPVPEEPEDVVEDPTPQPTPQPDQPAPSPSAQAPGNAVSIDGAAQAGGDAFNIGAGPGGGRAGAGQPGSGLGSAFGRREYARYFGGAVSQHLNRNRSGDLRNAVVQAQVRIWVTAAGGVSRVEFADGTGSADIDAEIRRLLLSMPAGRAPPADVLANQPVVTRINLRRNS